MSEEIEQGSQVQEQEQVVGTKPAAAPATNLIQDMAKKVEVLTKTTALNRAQKLADNIEVGYLELGGVLKVIYENGWFNGFETFDAFVGEKFGFQVRKAKYLMEIYEQLVTKQIPWDKVQHLGWTRLKDLAKLLTPENVDEWVAKAEKLTVAELQQLLKGDAPEGSTPSVGTNSDSHTLKFKLKQDQLETIQSALAKAKGEGNTEYDTTALELICAGFLSGSVGVPTGGGNLEETMKASGWNAVLELFDKLWPNISVTVEVPTE